MCNLVQRQSDLVNSMPILPHRQPDLMQRHVAIQNQQRQPNQEGAQTRMTRRSSRALGAFADNRFRSHSANCRVGEPDAVRTDRSVDCIDQPVHAMLPAPSGAIKNRARLSGALECAIRRVDRRFQIGTRSHCRRRSVGFCRERQASGVNRAKDSREIARRADRVVRVGTCRRHVPTHFVPPIAAPVRRGTPTPYPPPSATGEGAEYRGAPVCGARR
jgi:hypothetical protein